MYLLPFAQENDKKLEDFVNEYMISFVNSC